MIYSDEKDLQYHLNIRPGDVGKYVIICGDPKRAPKIAQCFDNPHPVADSREYVTFTGSLLGEPVSVCSTGIGGPSTAIAIEELANCGVHTIIRCGTCGAMQEDILGGQVIVATGAVRMEGTPDEYAPIQFPAVPNIDVVNAIVAGCKRAGATFHTGVVQCKDSFYGQHNPELMPIASDLEKYWKAWVDLGVIGSEMESSTLFVVSAYRKIRAGSLFLAVGNQLRQEKGLSNPIVKDTSLSIKCALESIKALIERDRQAKKG